MAQAINRWNVKQTLVLFWLFLFQVFGCKSSDKGTSVNNDHARKGEVLFSTYSCKTCHSLSGQKMYGPSLDSILNKQIIVIRHGHQVKVTIDREYLIRSIRDPSYEKVLEYQNKTMPKPDITGDEVNSLVEYLLQVNTSGPAGIR